MTQNRRYNGAVCKRILWGVATAAGVVLALWGHSLTSLADSTGTVKVASVKIREKADATSEVIGSASGNETVTITDEVQDSAGKLWYQVSVDGGKTGYIRADLIAKEGGDSSSQGTDADNTAGDQAPAADGAQEPSGATASAEQQMDAQYASVHVEAVKVRAAPSTNDTVVDRLAQNAQVVISGKSNGADGKEWYYVTFTGTDGSAKCGFIRSDLLTPGDMVPAPEEPEAEEPEEPVEPEETVNKDYELVYETEPDGSYAWYLYDHTQGGGDKKRVDQLLAAADAPEDEKPEDAKVLVKQRIAIVALVVLAVLLIIAVIIMALKLRDVYYEDYEDDEEEEEEPVAETPAARRRRAQEDEPQRDRRREPQTDERTARGRRREAQEEEAPQRRRRQEEAQEAPVRRRRRPENDEEAEAAERQARRRAAREARERGEREEAAERTSAKRRTKNFLLDDDEFEFEFLSMDDRD